MVDADRNRKSPAYAAVVRTKTQFPKWPLDNFGTLVRTRQGGGRQIVLS